METHYQLAPPLLEQLHRLARPTPSDHVYREECTLCFDNQDSPVGLDVCLTCFNGGCPASSVNEHSLLHYKKSGHPFALNIKRTLKPIAKSNRDEAEPPVKKLAIREEAPELEKYDFVIAGKCFDAEGSHEFVGDDKFVMLAEAVRSSVSSARKSEVKAWEEEITTCAHTLNLVQPEQKVLEAAGLASCAHPGCGLTANLWLCLVCGSLGCGRQQFGGGQPGNGHGVAHTQTTGHMVAVKMGTIEPEGTADIYCYACDDPKLDPKLSEHLANFGIAVAKQTKTQKSTTELQVEENLAFDFAMTGEDGKGLEPLLGPGLTGLRNLGNSCYMASTLQALFSFPAFQERYLTSFFTHVPSCSNPSPATCFECQMSKMADGLLSGRYSIPRSLEIDQLHHVPSPTSDQLMLPPSPPPVFQEGIQPSMFKSLIGQGHAEFSTMKQQDAEEFLGHLLDLVQKAAKQSGQEDPSSVFRFAVEERLQCARCEGVRYRSVDQDLLSVQLKVAKKSNEGMSEMGNEKEKVEYLPVELLDCLENYTSPSEVDDYHCPKCECNTSATKTSRFGTFPDVLAITGRRIQFIDWVQQKVDVPIMVPYTQLNLDRFKGLGIQEGEQTLPDDVEPQIVFNAAAMTQLAAMGFPEIRCQRALLQTGNNSGDAAMEWLFAHMDDADIDDPLPAPSATKASSEGPSPELIANIVEMGFSPAQARKALRETNGDPARAVEWVFNNPTDPGEDVAPASSSSSSKVLPGSPKLPANYRLKAFISHKGPSVHSGHYVAHVWMGEEQGWVLFNDEKVVKAGGGAQSAEALMPYAYVYLFSRT